MRETVHGGELHQRKKVRISYARHLCFYFLLKVASKMTIFQTSWMDMLRYLYNLAHDVMATSQCIQRNRGETGTSVLRFGDRLGKPIVFTILQCPSGKSTFVNTEMNY